jgi:hypothetical protein
VYLRPQQEVEALGCVAVVLEQIERSLADGLIDLSIRELD